MILFRCFPYNPAIKKIEPGHPLFIPVSRSTGRINNPDIYTSSYWSAQPECAVAEVYSSQMQWTPGTFLANPHMPKTFQAIAAINVPDETLIFNMDSAPNLVRLKLRPSRVVTRDSAVTQAWARKIFELRKYAGISWWSVLWPEWQSYGLWNLSGVEVLSVEKLSTSHPAVLKSAEVLNKQVLVR